MAADAKAAEQSLATPQQEPVVALQQKPPRQWWPDGHWSSAVHVEPSGFFAMHVPPLQYAVETQSPSLLHVVAQASAVCVAEPVQVLGWSGSQLMEMLGEHALSSSTRVLTHLFAVQARSWRWPWQLVAGASHAAGDE